MEQRHTTSVVIHPDVFLKLHHDQALVVQPSMNLKNASDLLCVTLQFAGYFEVLFLIDAVGGEGEMTSEVCAKSSAESSSVCDGLTTLD